MGPVPSPPAPSEKSTWSTREACVRGGTVEGEAGTGQAPWSSGDEQGDTGSGRGLPGLMGVTETDRDEWSVGLALRGLGTGHNRAALTASPRHRGALTWSGNRWCDQSALARVFESLSSFNAAC